MTAARYVELDVTTHFSFLRGASSPEELHAAAALLGVEALGCADLGSVAGVVRCWEAAKITGVRSIAGARLHLTDGRRLLLYPTDRAAWSRLSRLLTLGRSRAGKNGCDLAWADLAEWAEGLVAILLPEGGRGADAAALADLAALFGDRAHVALCLHRRPDDQPRLRRIDEAARAAGVRPVATGAVLYHAPEPRLLQDVMTAIREGCTVDELGYRREVNADRALKSADEMARRFAEAIGQLTGGVAHDFNNLLTVIRGSVDLLRRPDLSDERRRRYIDAIADTADRATKLTNQLLAFARRQSLRPERFEAAASVQSVSDMVRTLVGARVQVSVRAPAEPLFVDADRSQFDTAIVNMAVNARDAMRGEGGLTIVVDEVAEMPAIRSHPAVAGRFVTVALTDTGPGIAAGAIDQIFEPFFTTKGVGEGTGLGLSQVFGFTKQSGGDVLVRSEEGRGATFIMYLPRSAAPADAVRHGGDEAEPLGGGSCVLVVEDNADVGRFATQALAELGYGTVWAADGAEALAELAADADRFDVVFSDVMMPGMSGIELGKEIARLYPELPVVLTSGYSEVIAQTGTHGFDLVHKPYSIDELARAFGKISRRR